ncbi:MAG: hypothetical protein HZB15_15285 [Actinobacteria bacterium]|nr:hypothetical protein [Actinomycetota bacterium]
MPDDGGLVLVEVDNDSPLPVAVAFAGPPVLCSRPPVDVPVQGIDLPAGARVLPLGHRATITVALGRGRAYVDRALPASLPNSAQVANGWLAIVERAGRFDLPDRSLVEMVTEARCDIALRGLGSADDPAEHLFGAHQLVRMLGGRDDVMPDVAEAVERLARRLRRAGESPGEPAGESAAALDAAEAVARLAGDDRAAADVDAVRRHLAARGALGDRVWMPTLPQPTAARRVATIERMLARGTDLLPDGIPAGWWGTDFEVHGVPTSPGSSVSFAVRWHGERPAVLWETTGPSATLTASRAAPGWTTDRPAGDALWPAPGRNASVPSGSDQPASFS